MPLGVAIGYALPAIFIHEQDNLLQNKQQAIKHIFHIVLTEAIIVTVVSALVVLFIRHKPRLASSTLSNRISNTVKQSLRDFLRNKNNIVLIFGVGLA